MARAWKWRSKRHTRIGALFWDGIGWDGRMRVREAASATICISLCCGGQGHIHTFMCLQRWLRDMHTRTRTVETKRLVHTIQWSWLVVVVKRRS
jgi:hypothetical protein